MEQVQNQVIARVRDQVWQQFLLHAPISRINSALTASVIENQVWRQLINIQSQILRSKTGV